MVAAATRTLRPVTGCDQAFSARERIAAWSDPRAGGELKSEPTTENRNRAQRAPVELGVDGIITPPHEWVERTVKIRFHRPRSVGKEHLLRIGGDHGETLICRPSGAAMGERNRKRCVHPSHGGCRRRKESTSE